MNVMLAGANASSTGSHNRRVVLDGIRRNGPISRSELTRQTDLTLQTVSTIVGELMEEGWVQSRGRRSTPRGQPPIDYEINPQGAYALGASIGVNEVEVALADLSGRLLKVASTRGEFANPQETTLALLKLIEAVRSQSLPPSARLVGLGVALPGTTDTSTDTVITLPYIPGWEGFPLRSKLDKALQIPVYVANDGILAALGESWFGGSRAAQSFFYVIFAHDLGGAYVEHGQPLGGIWSMTGRFGHIPTGGSKGALGSYASPGALRAELGDARLSNTDLRALFAASDPRLLGWLDSAAEHLCTGLLTVENLFDPQHIVFGGKLPGALVEHLLHNLNRLLPPRRLKFKPHHPQLLIASAGERAAVLGAATLPLYQAISPRAQMVAQTFKG